MDSLTQMQFDTDADVLDRLGAGYSEPEIKLNQLIFHYEHCETFNVQNKEEAIIRRHIKVFAGAA